VSAEREWARAVVALASVVNHPYAPEEARALTLSPASLVKLWAQEQKLRLDVWAARGALGVAPLETFETWRDRRVL
jgi:hypothetical protein